jgi:hypothetical protein
MSTWWSPGGDHRRLPGNRSPTEPATTEGNLRMQPKPGRRRLASGAGALLLLTLSACGGGGDEAETATGDDGAAVDEVEETTTLPPVSGTLVCSGDALGAAAAFFHPGAAAGYERCSSAAAVAWLTGGDVNETVGFFKGENGAWVLISNAPLTNELAGALPPEIPAQLYNRWLAEKQEADAGGNPTATDDPNDGGGENVSRPGNVVDGIIDSENDPDNFTTTTTAPPPTTAPPQLDPYCIQYPSEPSCIANPYL